MAEKETQGWNPPTRGWMGRLRAEGRGPRIADDIDVYDWIELEEQVDGVSSNVKSIQYESPTKQLIVEFLWGGRYVYSGVPKYVAKRMFLSGSLGHFVWKSLRGKYPYSKIN
jgi:hypothetical protein